MQFLSLLALLGVCSASVLSLQSEEVVKVPEGRPHHHHHGHRRPPHGSASSSRISSHHVPGEHHHHRRRPCRDGRCPPKPEPKSSSSSTSSCHRRPHPHRSCSSSSSSSSSHHHHHRCSPQQLQQAAIQLTSRYQSYIANCQFGDAALLASYNAMGRTAWPECTNGFCCVKAQSLTSFFTSSYGACLWDVTFINQNPLQASAQVRPDGSVLVTAVEVDVLKADRTIKRINQVEWTWTPQHPHQYGPSSFCNLKLSQVKSRSYECGEIGLPNCSSCQI